MATLRMRQFCCDKTTEAGADEVYILVYARRTDGTAKVARIPANAPGQPNGHWDMNDGGQPTDNPNGDSHCITNKTLFSEDLPQGQTWKLLVSVMEEDGGSTEKLQQVAEKVTAESENPFVAGANAILAAFNAIGVNIQDTDDYIGSFSVSITNNGGSLSTEWGGGERLTHRIPDPDDAGNPNKTEYRFNGDGSNYVGWFSTEL